MTCPGLVAHFSSSSDAALSALHCGSSRVRETMHGSLLFVPSCVCLLGKSVKSPIMPWMRARLSFEATLTCALFFLLSSFVPSPLASSHRSQMSQELGITEKTPDFINPYRTERDDVSAQCTNVNIMCIIWKIYHLST